MFVKPLSSVNMKPSTMEEVSRRAVTLNVQGHKKLSLEGRTELRALKKHLKPIESLPPVAVHFLKCQLKKFPKPVKIQQYALEDRCLALDMYKESPRAYRLIQEIFALPSIKTTTKKLNKTPCQPGILHSAFSSLRRTVQRLSPRNRLCTLMFYDVEYLVNNGNKTSVGDPVYVFILQGIFEKWKLPVAFILCKSTTRPAVISRTFKKLVLEATAIGLSVIASVCNQGAANCRAINMLRKETRANALRRGEDVEDGIIIIGNKIIIPLFDPLHLLKSVCNHFLTKDILFFKEGETKVARWSHILEALKLDKTLQYHILTYRFPENKFYGLCSQMFRRHFAAALWAMSGGKSILDAKDTAILCSFFNRLFNSVHGSRSSKNRNRLKGPVYRRSPHARVWQDGITILKSMKYLPKTPSDRAFPQVLENFIITIQGFQKIFRHFQSLGYRSFETTAFNLDPVEEVNADPKPLKKTMVHNKCKNCIIS